LRRLLGAEMCIRVRNNSGDLQCVLKPNLRKTLSFIAKILTAATIFTWGYILIFKSGYFNNI
ncbi:MAG: hypothetical protein K2F81_04080, partial [Ruminococcus sp.]|nr:hypothetical protein [Ruminococcus sp.]